MRFTTGELDWLLARLRTNEEAAQLARIEMKVDALAGALTGSLGMIGGRLDALAALETEEITTLATTDEQIATISADVQQVIALYSALKTDDENEAAQLAALQQSLADAQAADGAGSPRALALQSIVDALTPILTPAAPAPPPVDTTGGTDPTGGTDTTDGTDTTGGGDQTPVPVDGGAGDGSAPTPSDPTA